MQASSIRFSLLFNYYNFFFWHKLILRRLLTWDLSSELQIVHDHVDNDKAYNKYKN